MSAAVIVLAAALLTGCMPSDPESDPDSVRFCTDLDTWWDAATALAQGRDISISNNVNAHKLAIIRRDMQATADRIADDDAAWSDLGDITKRLSTSRNWGLNAADVKQLRVYCMPYGPTSSSDAS
ncbi:hypothetical protein ACFWPQ_39585 [Streptomyces sp. NPDC058464]|uniref:hypothetical protein n=1 Tax=Streptomyces sp. NPDC058464 TaxID=3346511 RepID=UPI0036594292